MKNILLALSSAILLILSFPSFDLGLLAWIALVPLFIVLKNKGLKGAFGFSFITGIGFIAGIFFWVTLVNGFEWIDFITPLIYLGLYFGLFGLLFRVMSKRTGIPSYIIAPVLWVFMEYLRGRIGGFLALPWGFLGHSQYQNLPVIQITSITGVYGVSFLIVMVNVVLSEVILSRFRTFKPVMAVMIIFGVTLSYGFSVLSRHHSGDRVPITVIQGNIAIDEKLDEALQRRILDKQTLLTREALTSADPSLIVWPEGAVRGLLKRNPLLLNAVTSLARESNAYLLVGSSRYPKLGQRIFQSENMRELDVEDLKDLGPGEKVYIKRKFYNSAFLISPTEGLEGQYNKIRLLPFAEYLPYRDMLPWPERYKKTDNYTPGKEQTVFRLEDVALSVLICWENIFPDLFRAFVKKGAQVMINITNEAWFGETAAPYHFLSMSVLRAVENRVSVVRAANTGISCFIDPYGRIVGKVQNGRKDLFVEGYLTEEVPFSHEKTFYTQYGDMFAYTCLSFSIIMIALSFLGLKKFIPDN
jgi:apolipoprotein N-acyltransferase